MAIPPPSMRYLLASLIEFGKVVTTEARAKELKRQAERLISRSKKLDLAARRRVLASLPNRRAAEKLFSRIVPQFKDRIGGYVRVVKLPFRRGDQSPQARVEFVEEIKEGVKPVKAVKAVKPIKAKEPRKSVAKSPVRTKAVKTKK